QQLLRYERRSRAEAGTANDPQPGRFWRWLGGGRSRSQAGQGRHARNAHPMDEGPPALRHGLSLQLLLELIEKVPVGALGDDLLRARLDHAGLVEAERVEANRVFRAVLPPSRIGDVLESLERVVVASSVASVHEEPRNLLGL